jgi:serine/threonine protein phosphatase PrpC
VEIRYASLTDVGVKRSHNQDACAAQPADAKHWAAHGHVFIVADGMGGHAVGEKASAKAVRDIPLTYTKHVAQEGVVAAIRRAFEEANESIFQIGVNNPEFKGLGTTGTALVVRPEGAWVGHVGDSRAYRVRGNRVQQLTFDHSWVWEVARRQGIDPDELGDFKKNVIIRSLGPDAEVEVDIEGPYPLEAGDTFLMCSDGLTNEVMPDEIGAVASVFSPDEACRYLIELANIRGGRDNVTCLIVQVPASAVGLGPKATGVVRKLKRVAGRAGRVVPLPFVVLAAGALAAVASVTLQLEGFRELALPAFGLATLMILAGLVGLYLHIRRKNEAHDSTPVHTRPTELHLYRDYAFEFGPALAERFRVLDADLTALGHDRPEVESAVEWETHEGFVRDAEAAANQKDWINAFAARFRAVMVLATAFNGRRGGGEHFKPNWT